MSVCVVQQLQSRHLQTTVDVSNGTLISIACHITYKITNARKNILQDEDFYPVTFLGESS